MEVKKAYVGKGRHPMHRFLFNIGGAIKAISTKVRGGNGMFSITLTEDHVLRAIKANGYGDAQNCAGAVCIRDHAEVIPHKFTGYIDFWDTRAFLSCRNDATTNLPSHSVAWKHNQPKIAKLFDSKPGRRKLLEQIRNDGPITITFTPPAYRSGSATGKKSGASDPLKRKHRIGHTARVIRVKNGALMDVA